MYSVFVPKSVEKQIRKLPSDIEDRVRVVIDGLKSVPQPQGCETMQGHRNIYRLRVGDYRIVYKIEKSRVIIEVVAVGHRKDIYRDF